MNSETFGVRINSVKDAENVLVNNESTFVESLKRRSMAAAAMELDVEEVPVGNREDASGGECEKGHG